MPILIFGLAHSTELPCLPERPTHLSEMRGPEPSRLTTPKQCDLLDRLRCVLQEIAETFVCLAAARRLLPSRALLISTDNKTPAQCDASRRRKSAARSRLPILRETTAKDGAHRHCLCWRMAGPSAEDIPLLQEIPRNVIAGVGHKPQGLVASAYDHEFDIECLSQRCRNQRPGAGTVR